MSSEVGYCHFTVMVRTRLFFLVIMECFLMEQSVQDAMLLLIGLEIEPQKLDSYLILPHMAV
jgi:hypothetical protein